MASRASRPPCACAALRRASRVLSQMYDDELRSLGLKNTQLAVLQAVGSAGSTTQARLAQELSVDSTTLSRNVKVLEGNGWLQGTEGGDRRERVLSLTGTGQELVRQAERPWNRVQERLRKSLGEGRWEQLFELVEAVRKASR